MRSRCGRADRQRARPTPEAAPALRWTTGLLVGLLSAPAIAATLSGTVTDAQDGEPLHYATVAVQGLSLGGLTNEAGSFAVSGIPAGRHVVAFSHIGYVTRRDTLSFTDTGVLRLEVELQPEVILLSGETVVTAQRQQQEVNAQVGFAELQPKQLAALPAAGEPDLLRALQLLPGIKSASDVSSGLYVRGGGPDQTAILLDQVQIYNPSHAFGFFSTFNPDAVKEVGLYKGAYPAAYGGNLGAVLDVSSRRGNDRRFHGSGGVSLISSRLLLERPSGSGSWMLAGRRTYLDPVLAGLRAAGVEAPGYYFYDLNGKLDLNPSDADEVVLSAFLSQDNLRFEPDRETYVRTRWGNRAVAGTWRRVFSPVLFGRMGLSASAYRSTTSLSFFDTPILVTNRIRDLSLRGDLYYAAGGHALEAGARITSYATEYDEAFNQQRQLARRDLPWLAAAYGQDEWQVAQRTRLRIGGRVEHFSAGDRWLAMPRLSLGHDLRPDVRLRLGGGLYYQYLQLVTTEGFAGGDYWVPLDRAVRPSRSAQAVAGVDWPISGRYRAAAEAYYTDLRDLVVLDNQVAVNRSQADAQALFKTGGTGHAEGLELFIERQTGRLTGWLGYTLGWTRRRFPEINGGRSFPPKYDRRHDLSFVASYRRGPWTWGASFLYGTGQAFTPAAARYSLRSPSTGVVEDYVLPAERNSARLLPYRRLDLGVRRPVRLAGRPAEAYLQVFNVYSRRNEWFVQYDTDSPATAPKVVKMLPVIPTVGLDFEL